MGYFECYCNKHDIKYIWYSVSNANGVPIGGECPECKKERRSVAT